MSILDSIFSFCFESFIRFVGFFGVLSLGLHAMDNPNLVCFQLKNKKLNLNFLCFTFLLFYLFLYLYHKI